MKYSFKIQLMVVLVYLLIYLLSSVRHVRVFSAARSMWDGELDTLLL